MMWVVLDSQTFYCLVAENRQPQRKFLLRGENRNRLHLLCLPNQPYNMAKQIRLRILLIPSFAYHCLNADLFIGRTVSELSLSWYIFSVKFYSRQMYQIIFIAFDCMIKNIA